MDSITQIVLGAAVGEAMLGRKLGNKAILLGAIGGTIPDLDVVYNFINDDPIRQLAVHRGYSHSMFTHLVLAIPLAWISTKWNKAGLSIGTWYLFWFLCLFTHALLDCCTTYGTQFFLPFTNYQVAFNNISVVDPFYTIPFLIILGSCMFFKRNSRVRKNLMIASIVVSSAYMLFTFGIKFAAHEKFKKDLSDKGIKFVELNTTPTIFNAVLWSAIAYDDSLLHVAEYSFVKNNDSIRWISFNRNLDQIAKYESKAIRTIQWFSDGNYFVEPLENDTLAFYNVKWGRMRFDAEDPANAFFFYWKFYIRDHEVKYMEIRRDDWSFKESFSLLRKRIGV